MDHLDMSERGALQPSDLMFDPPALSPVEVAAVVRERYGIDGTMQRLRGERDHNTLVTTTDGAAYVLKVASPSEAADAARFQCRALLHVERRDADLLVPRVIRTLDGDTTASVEVDGRSTSARLLTFLPGTTFDDAGVVPIDALGRVGGFQGRLAAALRDFDDPAAPDFMPWALDSGVLGQDELWDGLTPAALAVARPCRERIDAAVAGMASLPRQIVHNDGHRGNLLRPSVTSFDVVGAIDFGDLVHTATVADLAIGGASFLVDQPDLLDALVALAAGFHAATPLRVAEVDGLVDLVLCRLVLSTLLCEYQVRESPHIAADVAAELPGILAGLARWRELDPAVAARRLHAELT